MTTAELGVWWPGNLELRQRGSRISGSFPYDNMATIRASGRVRKERIQAGAFRFALEDDTREINLLVGHSYGQPLASKLAGSLTLSDSPKALSFEAPLPSTSWADDLRAGIEGGAASYGISPGFSMPPASAVPGAEVLTPERGNPGVMVRTITAAILHEVSVVTRAAYSGTGVDIRHEELSDDQEREFDAEELAADWRRRAILALV